MKMLSADMEPRSSFQIEESRGKDQVDAQKAKDSAAKGTHIPQDY